VSAPTAIELERALRSIHGEHMERGRLHSGYSVVTCVMCGQPTIKARTTETQLCGRWACIVKAEMFVREG
jgi:hypothetical protein